MAGTIQFPKFDTDEPLWYDNGKWGKAGYAIPNPGGKVWTNNSVIFTMTQLIGRQIFELSHRDEVKFYAAPHKQFWFELHQLLTVGRKRLTDETRLANDSNGLTTQHVNPSPQVFLVYPLPYFGERIRQQDIRRYIELCLMMLGEMMQHSDNDRIGYVTPEFTGQIGKYVQEVLALMAMKYFGKTRTEAYAPAFTLADADFTAYNPSKFMLSVEMSEERPPLQWWPTENDLSQIRGLPINEALMLAKRWPQTEWGEIADGNVFPDPTNQEQETSSQGSGVVTGASSQTLTGAFIPPPNQAP